MTFEFDKTGGPLLSPAYVRINVDNNYTITVPAAGGGFGGVADGDFFAIDPDGAAGITRALVFEFVEQGSTRARFGDVSIPFTHFTSPDDLADRIVNAVNANRVVLNLTAAKRDPLVAGRVILDGTTPAHLLTKKATSTLNVTVEVPPTRDEVTERIIAALDAADETDGRRPGINAADLGRMPA